MSTVVPPAWIIEEKIRQDKERRRKEGEGNELPISHPGIPNEATDDFEKDPDEPEKKETVIIIDI